MKRIVDNEVDFILTIAKKAILWRTWCGTLQILSLESYVNSLG
jgi:hypothetical protein